MRLIAVALLLLVWLPFPATAQEPAALLTDAAGDVQLAVEDQPGTPTSLYPSADVVGLTLTESATGFAFALELADLKPGTEDTGVDGVTYEILFTHNSREFQLIIYRSLPGLSDFPFPLLNMRDRPQDDWSTVWADPFAMTTDYVADVMTIPLPREVLADAQGATPFPGRTLDSIQVHVRSQLSDATINVFVPVPVPLRVTDDMPNAGQAPASYPVQFGVQQSGHARLSSYAPFRASNGEATTYVMQVIAENLGDDVDDFELVATNIPERLTVVLPVPYLTLEAEESIEIPVLVTVPFGHDHGSASQFLLELRSTSDPESIGRIELGVRFLAVPQPAGHHDTLWLHPPAGDSPTFGGILPFDQGVMNTLEDDPAAGEGTYYSVGFSSSGITFRHSWSYSLTPALELGLDVDLFRTGQYSIPVSTTTPILQATLSGSLWLEGNFEQGGILLGTLAASDPADLDAQSTTLFTGDFLPGEDGDEIPFQPGQNLYLHVELESNTPMPLGTQDEGPGIAPGAWLQLPLNEWHDPVNEALAALDGPALRALSPQERFINPGKAAAYEVRVTNPLDEGRTIRLAVSGPNAAWAQLPDSVRVPAGESVNVTVILRAPADAVHGERADLVLQAYSKDEPNARGLLRLVAQVDTREDLPDDLAANQETGAKQSPGLGWLVLAALAFAARRRTR